jgi:hypothetical protein
MNRRIKTAPNYSKNLLMILFSFLFNISLFSQSSTDSLDFISTSKILNLLSTSFDKRLNTYSLNSGLVFNQDIGNFNFKIAENFNSKFVETTTKNIRDEQRLNILTSYRISPVFSSGIASSNKILSDNRKIEINQASVSNVSLFTLYAPQPNLEFSPFIGYSNNRQIGENDYGLVYGIEGIADNENFSDFNLSSRLKFRNEEISPRKNLIRYFNVIVNNNFTEDVSNIISAGFTENRKDFYYTADQETFDEFNIVNNIQSRTETGYAVEDRLHFGNFFEIFTLDSRGNISWREIDRNTRYRASNTTSASVFDTRIEESRIELESTMSYRSKFFSGNLRGIVSERDERNITKNFDGSNSFFFEERSNQESQKNNNSSRASLSFSGNFNLSKKDRLSLSLLQNKLRYDTPNEENFDDRDEILSILRVKYSRFLTPFFEGFVSTEGIYSHIVYLFSEKSSNNNINRVLKFTAGGNYTGKNVSSLNTFEVSANYTVYDFEDLNPNFKSFSFRQFTATDSSNIKIFKDLSFNSYGYLKFSEQGDFKWASFSARPTRFLEEIYAEPKITLNLSGILLAVGLRYFSLKSFNYDVRNKILDSKYISRGPLMEVFFLVRNVLYFRTYGWYEFISIDETTKQQQINFIIQMNWNF